MNDPDKFIQEWRKFTIKYDLSGRDVNLILQEAQTITENDSIKRKALAYANDVHMQNDNYPSGTF